jgi:Ca-activated chloride channel family protein
MDPVELRRIGRRAGKAAPWLLWLAVPGLLSAQAPRRAPSFGTGVEGVRLNLTVVDAQSRFVTDLTEADFAVFEDGVPQAVDHFARLPLPLSVTLLVDCSTSMVGKMDATREAAMAFLATLAPHDLAQVVQFNQRVTTLQDFTADRSALAAALRGAQPSGSTGLYNAVYVSLLELRRLREPEGLRRQAIVLLSDGEDTASVASDEQVLDLARRSEVTIYSIGLRPDLRFDDQRLAFSRASQFLTSLAQATGGQALFTRSASELTGLYGRIAEELRSQYTLGYVSANPRRDGAWRRIAVRTPGREGLVVRHRVGYFAPRS